MPHTDLPLEELRRHDPGLPAPEDLWDFRAATLREAAGHPLVTLEPAPLGVGTVTEALTPADPDPYPANTTDRHDRVRLRPCPRAEVAGSRLRVTLPPVSWTAVSLR
jgi:hypothetical protein